VKVLKNLVIFIDIYLMRKLQLIIFFVLSFNANLRAQDSVMYSKEFRLYEGIYINYEDLRFNWPIDKEKIITNVPKEQLDFFSKLVESDIIEYKERDGSVIKIKTEKIWGYCQNNVIFINQENSFFRIPVFGAISSFIGAVAVINHSPGFDPFMNTPSNSTAHSIKEFRPFLFDFYSGDITEFSLEKLEEYLSRDICLVNEFKQLRKKKKKEYAAKYIRLFNEKHPVFFPKG
jgi:hypothetical protein